MVRGAEWLVWSIVVDWPMWLMWCLIAIDLRGSYGGGLVCVATVVVDWSV